MEKTTELYWRHKKTGNHYKMHGVALRESDLVPVVLYQEIDDFSLVGPVWVRAADDFFDGRFEPYDRNG